MWKAIRTALLGTIALAMIPPTVSWSEGLVFPFEQTLTLNDQCAVFNTETVNDDGVTFIHITYGEPIDFDLKGAVQAIIETNETTSNLKFQIKMHGEGVGQDSGIQYILNSKAQAKANANGYDLSGLDPTDPNFDFNGKFNLEARVIGKGNDASDGLIAQGAQDNAVLHFALNIHYVNGEIQTSTSDFSLECAASPWTNLMQSPDASDRRRTPVGRGYGDPWNKYPWSMKEINGGMLVGTKNAFYDILEYFSPSAGVQYCLDNNVYQVTSIHAPLACMELFAAPTEVGVPAAADTRFAQIWRFDYAKKTWSNVYEDGVSQGFRYMESHNGKVYVGSDLGAFITGVDLFTGGPGDWNFPGTQLLVTDDGKAFDVVGSCEDSGPCNSAEHLDNPYGLIGTNPVYTGAVNISIRALASYKGKLYVGTFNALGGQLWAYDDEAGSWTQIIIPGINNPPNPYKPAITELRVFNDILYIGIAGPANNNYLFSYDGTGSPAAVAGQPDFSSQPSNVGVIKLFTNNDGLLYIGNVDLSLGFSLMTYDGSDFEIITENGFDNPYNAYPWSMAEINGRTFVGTFNQDFLSTLPRGSAELWYSDDPTVWQQVALPLDWGEWNYGIRTMDVGNRLLFLGAASNMVAPDLISEPIPLQPGAEVWTIRDTKVAPTGKKDKHKP